MPHFWSGWSGFRRLRGKLTLAYALTTIVALLLLELVAILAIFVAVNVALPQFVLLGLRSEAQQAATYFVHGTPDRAALTAWVNIPDPYAGGTYQSGYFAVVDQQAVVIAAVGGQAPAAGTPLAPRLAPAAASDFARLLDGRATANQIVAYEPDGALVVAVPIESASHTIQGAVVQLVANRGQANAFWIGFYLTDVILPSTLIFLLFGAVAGTIFGLYTARGFTRRFARVATVVDRWSQGDFSLMAQDRSDDELGQLARRLNRMAEQLQHLLRTRQKLATLEERNRLARDLHDSVKQQVFAVSLQVSTAKGLMESDSADARAHLVEAEQLVRQAQQELTALIRELRPVALEHQGLVPALEEYLAQWSQQTGIAAHLHAEGNDEPPATVEESLFRIAQEALANVARHSQATSVDMRVACARDGATLTVHDNGIGFDATATDGHGVGLHSMRERAQTLGGALQIESTPGQGTTVTARCSYSAVEA